VGQSTDGIIAYGVMCGEEELPWDEEHDGDIEEWWFDQTGYAPTFYPFTQEGGFKPGIKPEDEVFRSYYSEREQWRGEHPCPVDVVNYCHGDFPMNALVVPSTEKRCHRGYPLSFEPENLMVSRLEKVAFADFLDKHLIEHEGPPRWLLMSYWG